MFNCFSYLDPGQAWDGNHFILPDFTVGQLMDLILCNYGEDSPDKAANFWDNIDRPRLFQGFLDGLIP